MNTLYIYAIMYMNKNLKETEVYTLNNFAQIINFIMYVIDLIQSWFNGGAAGDDKNNADDNANEVV